MFENLQQIWQRQSAPAKAGLVLGTSLIMAVLIYLSYSVLKPDYQVLFSGLDPQDAATIVAELDKLKTSYRLGSDETSILVDAGQVHATRLKLMGKGVNLRGGVGFEIFNNTDFGVTEFAQRINYQRALQGELARTIMALDEVKSARVHLVLAEAGMFKKTSQKPKASITLAVRENRSLQSEQVVGIQRLVAASVPQIDPMSVTVLDQRGVALSRNVDPDSENASMGLDSKHELEAYLTRKAVAVLDKAFGPGSAIVSVDVTLNHEQVKTTREDVRPHAEGSRSTRAITRQRTSVQAAPATPIVATAATDQPAPARASTSEIEYQNSRMVEQTVSKPGSVRRISVGVLLPQTLESGKLKEITQVLSMAVGLNAERGDEIAISALDRFAVARSVQRAIPEAVGEALPREMTPGGRADANSGDSVASRLGDWLGLDMRGARGVTIALGGALALLVLLILAVALLGSRRQRPPAPLGARERERLLAQMRQWLGAQEG